MKNINILIIAFLSICVSVTAQKKSGKELRGDKYIFNYSYQKAIDSYNRAKDLTIEGQCKLAESYYNTGQNIKAEEVNAELTKVEAGLSPEIYYNYAMVLKSNGKYDLSELWMEKFVYFMPEDLRAISYRKNLKELVYMQTDEGKYNIENMTVNTGAEDFGPCYYKNGIVFSSNNSGPKMIVRKYSWTGNPFWDLYFSEIENGQMKKPEKFDKIFNGRMHDGPASFSNDGNHIAFTRNNYKDKTKDRVVELQIFFSDNENGKWSKPVPFKYNSEEYSVGQPCLTSDGKTMYFTSDISGGCGGSDIYKVTKDETGEWGSIRNMGKEINTEGNEMFPFFEEQKGVLYFSSDGLFGLGGMDIFMCPLSGTETGKVTNAGFPLNTRYNDYSIIVNGKTGYFASDRPGGSGLDDIYSVGFLKELEIGNKIEGIAMESNGNPVPNTFVTIYDEFNNEIESFTTLENGAFSFIADPEKNYKLTGEKEKYADGEIYANTFGSEYIVSANIILVKNEEIVPVLVEEVKPEETKNTTTVINTERIFDLDDNTIYFDYGKYNIREDAVIKLDKVVAIMNEYPEMTVELSSYTDCRADNEFNQKLSDQRAKATIDYVRKRITNPERVTGKGYGETNLVNGCYGEKDIVSDCTEDEHQKNRRTEFNVVIH